MNDAFLLRRDVAKALGDVHIETVKRWEREGRLPPPVRLSRKTVGHLQSTVERFLASACQRHVGKA
ncbi:hypothetical protein [Roseateles sp.]|uniref:helix-turn-helix transcriptional regulator n=1 Tax=Roseateles sp. TaxID=1971397 RepID=UPI002DFABA36|nr:hypothetical protein [Roseateles sp.]